MGIYCPLNVSRTLWLTDIKLDTLVHPREWIHLQLIFCCLHVLAPNLCLTISTMSFHPVPTSSDGHHLSLDVLILDHNILQLMGQQLWPNHYSLGLDVQQIVSRCCHTQHDALHAASARCLTEPLRTEACISGLWNSFHTDCAGNPLHPIITENNIAFQPLYLQFAMRSAYVLVFLRWVSRQWSSHCTFSWIDINFFDCFNWIPCVVARLSPQRLEKQVSCPGPSWVPNLYFCQAVMVYSSWSLLDLVLLWPRLSNYSLLPNYLLPVFWAHNHASICIFPV
jgi:hypothetical protein